ncbi:MAG: hypothetical protein IIY55_02325 [Blautia sp.]|nr:hypothetical protein [Blautia sp.]
MAIITKKPFMNLPAGKKENDGGQKMHITDDLRAVFFRKKAQKSKGQVTQRDEIRSGTG